MTIKIICEDESKQRDYIEHIVNHCMWVDELPMKLVLSSKVENESYSATKLLSEADMESYSAKMLLQEVGRESDSAVELLPAGGGEDYKITEENDRIEHGMIVEEKKAIDNNVIGSRGVCSKTNKSGVVESHDLIIDMQAHRVMVDNKERFLSKTEFSILAYLAKKPNHVCSKEEILENVWHSKQKKSESTLMVHIKNIREKIEFNYRYPRRIETIRGVGYRLNV